MCADGGWTAGKPALVSWIDRQRDAILGVYASDPVLIEEHGRQEDSFRTGGYAHRQVLELVQNAADAQHRASVAGRVELVLAGGVLYCANEGEPFTEDGLKAVCHAYLSPKEEEEIGRFGLGFKSVLGITDRPAVFSRSVSFGFDAHQSRIELQSLSASAENFPVLRLPYHLDAQAEFAADAVLAGLAEWAQTIIRLPLRGDASRLMEDLEGFPPEFLLFASSVSVLTINLVAQGVKFEYTCEPTGASRWSLTAADGSVSEWAVWSREHSPSVEALEEVSKAIRRPQVKVSYAAPLDDTQSLGRFWAFFPLTDVTSTRGIHNALWRINDDRTGLLDGLFNQELLSVLADLVVAGMPALTSPEDPARHFDYLPARGREAPNFADRLLADLIPSRAATVPCVPDADGVLRVPSDLIFAHSDLRLDLESFGLWDKAPSRPSNTPHWTCYKTTTRRARLKSLLRRDENRAAEVEVGAARWLELLVQDGTDEQCEAALRVYSTVTDVETRRDMGEAKVVRDETGSMWRLSQTDEIFVRGNLLSQQAGLSVVRPSFLELEGVEERLRSLGFVDVDPKHELAKLAATASRAWTAEEWDGFWQLVLEVNVNDAQEILTRHVLSGAPLLVLCLDGEWHPFGEVVAVGRLVHPASPEMTLNDEYHALHLGMLRSIGVAEEPVVTPSITVDALFLEYQRSARTEYLDSLQPRGRPDAIALKFAETQGLTPLDVLRKFRTEDDSAAVAAWSRALLDHPASESWELRHPHHNVFPSQQFRAPHIWAVQNHGLLETGWGLRRPAESLAPDLTEFCPELPVALWPSAAKLKTIPSLDAVPVTMWREFLDRVPTGGSAWSIGRLMAAACRILSRHVDYAPEKVPAVVGNAWSLVSPRDLLVATSEDECRALARVGLPHVALEVGEDATFLCPEWGCRPAASELRVDIVAESPGEPSLLLDRYRGLRALAGPGVLDDWDVTECSGLIRQVTGVHGTQSEPIEVAFRDHSIFYLKTLSEEALLENVSGHFALGMDGFSIARLLTDAQDESVKRKITECRTQIEIPNKLLALLPPASLETCLPSGLLETVRTLTGDGGALQVAELLLHVEGYSVLSALKRELRDAGFDAPDRWAGSPPAVAFVRRMGFPVEYARSQGVSREADITVLGPPNLPPLHDYQEALAADIRSLVNEREKPSRALLFLPTGAGKTRVTVEAIARAVIEDGLPGPLLWIAQTDELCEQAVETWSIVWRELGDRPIRVCRLWGSNEVASSDVDVTIVVATDAKLDKCRDREEYDWLAQASAVIIDEAHGATAEGITATLKWLGIEGRKTARPLLGLTATPFKGTSEEATRRLANRFGKRLLEIPVPDPYRYLQELSVLAAVEHRVLGGMAVSLDYQEFESLKTMRELPASVLDKIGRDQARMQTLLDDIATLPRDWPTLVFTASVLSAQILSTLLRTRGHTSASVSGTTPMAERRRSIEGFRRGDIQVITNCNVLTQGFDAPGVRALYIARPTFSPNAYIQMVGRGLRGPANGGKDECRVVNIEDTFDQFGQDLAYKEFAYLWENQGVIPT